MGGQKAQSKKQKRKKKKNALQPFQQQQHAAAARMIDDGEINEEYGSNTSEQERENSDDGRYKKEIYVKTWTGRTITVVFDPERAAKNLKRFVAAKTGIPTESQQLTFGGKALMDKVLMKEYNISGRETIEMTAKLPGGMKKKSFSPKPMDTKREKRKDSEPCIDVGDSIEEGNAETHPDIDPPDNTQWMEDTMKKLKERTDDVSELARNMSRVQWNMTEVERKLDKVTNSLTLINKGNEARDKNLDEVLACFSVGLEKQEKRRRRRSTIWKEASVRK